MSRDILKNKEFDQIISLINEARTRVFNNANSELVLLNFNVDRIVSNKVNTGKWGENAVQQLAAPVGRNPE